MITRIHCPECSWKPLHAEDVAEGWHQRIVHIVRAKKPEEHSINFTSAGETTIHPLSELHCDLCNAVIADGTSAVAITSWRGGTEPDQWEHQYGELTKK